MTILAPPQPTLRLPQWRAARAQASTQRVHVACFGTSITEGYNATSRLTGGWARLLGVALGSASAGIGIVPVYRTDYWTYTGAGWGNSWGPYGLGKQATGSSNTASIALDCDSVTIFYADASATGAFTVNVDGSFAANVGSSSGSLVFRSATVSCGSYGTHTIELVAPSAAATYIAFWGVAANIGSVGVQVHNIGLNGSQSNQSTASDRIGILDAVQPDLTIVEFVPNDYAAQVALATFESNLTTIANKAVQFGDVLFLAAEHRAGSFGSIPQTAYNDVMIKLANTYAGAEYVSVYQKWGNAANATYSDDGTHPNDAGHVEMTTLLKNVLLR